VALTTTVGTSGLSVTVALISTGGVDGESVGSGVLVETLVKVTAVLFVGLGKGVGEGGSVAVGGPVVGEGGKNVAVAMGTTCTTGSNCAGVWVGPGSSGATATLARGVCGWMAKAKSATMTNVSTPRLKASSRPSRGAGPGRRRTSKPR
jgi:hypothetical protein